MAWELAWRAMSEFLRAPQKVDGLPTEWDRFDLVERRRAQRLFYGALRWNLALEAFWRPHVRQWPRPRLAALLVVAGFELITAGERRPAVVHAAVDLAKARLSAGEGKLINALLRRLATSLAEGWAPDPADAHPKWLWKRWKAAFGPEATAALGAWNQSEEPVYIRWDAPESAPTEWVQSDWDRYFILGGPEAWVAARSALKSGAAYIQDPFARHPIELLAPTAGEAILDACAAPGGKTRALARAARLGLLVALDLPGARSERLTENLRGTRVRQVAADLTEPVGPVLAAVDLPTQYDGVLLDVPCSNTGVLARRPDVRFHLNPAQLAELPVLQETLLRQAAACVRPGGRLVYSTCSLEREENEDVVDGFLAAFPEWQLTEKRLSRPWVEGHDGGGAFLLTRAVAQK